MVKALIMFSLGMWFSETKYGQPSIKWIKKNLSTKTDIVKFDDDKYAIRVKWTFITLYRNLQYTGNDPAVKWSFSGADDFYKCKGTLDQCKAMMNDSNDVVVETVTD